MAPPTKAEFDALVTYVRLGSAAHAAEALFISERTVNNHLDHMRERYELRTRAQLIALAVEEGWIPKHCWEE